MPSFATVAAIILLARYAGGSVLQDDKHMISASDRKVADLVLSAMNRSADPCEDFYEYACGSWIQQHKLAHNETEHIKKVDEENQFQEEITGLLESMQREEDNKAGLFYASCLQQFAQGDLNIAPLARFQPLFRNLSSPGAVVSALGTLRSNGVTTAFFTPIVDDDQDQPDIQALYLAGAMNSSLISLSPQGNGTNVSTVIGDDNETLVVWRTILGVAGKAGLIPQAGHDRILRLIVDLAIEIRDAVIATDSSNEGKFVRRSLSSFPHGLPITKYLAAAGINQTKLNNSVFVDSPGYFDRISDLFGRTSNNQSVRDVVRGIMACDLVTNFASWGLLGQDLFDAFNSTATQPRAPLQSECQGATNKFFGEAVARAYVRRYVTEQNREKVAKLVRDVIGSFDAVIVKQNWLDEKTRAEARRKLSEVGIRIGYSTEIDTYDDVRVNRNSFAENVAAATLHQWHRDLADLGGPISRSSWIDEFKFVKVQATYVPYQNAIQVSAGMLRYPFFDVVFPDAMNYGFLGFSIGHELSHGEDNLGREYDAMGRRRKWWSAKSSAKFIKRSECYVSLYDTYRSRGLVISENGTLTLDENLADCNGIKFSYLAFKNATANRAGSALNTGDTKSGKGISRMVPANGRPANKALARLLTNDQLFFVYYAHGRCEVVSAKSRVYEDDPHSPGEFRVLGPLSQMKEFADAFQCKPGSKYNPEKRCSLFEI